MKPKVLLLGASTGGPSQIKELLSSIKKLSSTIIIAQHMDVKILPYFIKDLNEALPMKVMSTPTNIDFLEPSVIICSATSVIKKESHQYSLSICESSENYTPDINTLFNSFVPFASAFELRVIIMTGIGYDGVSGAQNLRALGVKIYAQDEKSSPVYGMPKAAYEMGIVDKIMSLQDLKIYFENL